MANDSGTMGRGTGSFEGDGFGPSFAVGRNTRLVCASTAIVRQLGSVFRFATTV